MIWNFLKNIFLGLFGMTVIVMGSAIIPYFDKELNKDGFFLNYMAITWTAYIACKTYLECNRLNK